MSEGGDIVRGGVFGRKPHPRFTKYGQGIHVILEYSPNQLVISCGIIPSPVRIVFLPHIVPRIYSDSNPSCARFWKISFQFGEQIELRVVGGAARLVEDLKGVHRDTVYLDPPGIHDIEQHLNASGGTITVVVVGLAAIETDHF